MIKLPSRILDLSVPLDNETVFDPPLMRPKIDYKTNQENAWRLPDSFPGVVRAEGLPAASGTSKLHRQKCADGNADDKRDLLPILTSCSNVASNVVDLRIDGSIEEAIMPAETPTAATQKSANAAAGVSGISSFRCRSR